MKRRDLLLAPLAAAAVSLVPRETVSGPWPIKQIVSGQEPTYAWARILAICPDGGTRRVPLVGDDGIEDGYVISPIERHLLVRVRGGTPEQAAAQAVKMWNDGNSFKRRSGLIPALDSDVSGVGLA